MTKWALCRDCIVWWVMNRNRKRCPQCRRWLEVWYEGETMTTGSGIPVRAAP